MTEQHLSATRDRILALAEGETDSIALMATTACELFHSDDRFDWVGFYRVVAPEMLAIGPYQGGHGCLRIPFARGVCGAAAAPARLNSCLMSIPFPATSPVRRPPARKSSCPSSTNRTESSPCSTSTATAPMRSHPPTPPSSKA